MPDEIIETTEATETQDNTQELDTLKSENETLKGQIGEIEKKYDGVDLDSYQQNKELADLVQNNEEVAKLINDLKNNSDKDALAEDIKFIKDRMIADEKTKTEAFEEQQYERFEKDFSSSLETLIKEESLGELIKPEEGKAGFNEEQFIKDYVIDKLVKDDDEAERNNQPNKLDWKDIPGLIKEGIGIVSQYRRTINSSSLRSDPYPITTQSETGEKVPAKNPGSSQKERVDAVREDLKQMMESRRGI